LATNSSFFERVFPECQQHYWYKSDLSDMNTYTDNLMGVNEDVKSQGLEGQQRAKHETTKWSYSSFYSKQAHRARKENYTGEVDDDISVSEHKTSQSSFQPHGQPDQNNNQKNQVSKTPRKNSTLYKNGFMKSPRQKGWFNPLSASSRRRQQAKEQQKKNDNNNNNNNNNNNANPNSNADNNSKKSRNNYNIGSFAEHFPYDVGKEKPFLFSSNATLISPKLKRNLLFCLKNIFESLNWFIVSFIVVTVIISTLSTIDQDDISQSLSNIEPIRGGNDHPIQIGDTASKMGKIFNQINSSVEAYDNARRGGNNAMKRVEFGQNDQKRDQMTIVNENSHENIQTEFKITSLRYDIMISLLAFNLTLAFILNEYSFDDLWTYIHQTQFAGMTE
jgi:hypothetical protein